MLLEVEAAAVAVVASAAAAAARSASVIDGRWRTSARDAASGGYNVTHLPIACDVRVRPWSRVDGRHKVANSNLGYSR